MQSPAAGATRTAIVASSFASLLPLIVCWQQFRLLFFFHDDWELLDRAARLGLARWLTEPFLGEGVFPLFKLLWLGAVNLTGSYFGMILLLWLTHVAICLLFGWLLGRFGLPPVAIAVALLLFGLSWTNIETLGWAMQWNAQLAIVFFLVAWHFLLNAPGSGWRAAACFLCLLASGLCSSRGVASGPVLAIFVLLQPKRQQRLPLFFLCLAPAVLLLAVMSLMTPGHPLSPISALAYASEYLILNPLFRPLPFPRQGFQWFAILTCAALKLAIFLYAFRKAAPSARALLWTLVALDLVVAVSLGYSRWSTGLETTVSSRYQYISLLCFGPMAGILVAQLKPVTRLVIITLCVAGLLIPWKRHADQWAAARGIRQREAVQSEGASQRFDPSSLTAGRARELIQIYGLRIDSAGSKTSRASAKSIMY